MEEVIFAVGRVSERLLITVAGGMSLVMGWSLYKKGVLDTQEAELTKGTFSLKLTKVGPGVFFAIFGCAILVAGLRSPLTSGGVSVQQPDHQSEQPGVANTRFISYAGGSEVSQQDLAQAINSVRYLLRHHDEIDPDGQEVKEILRCLSPIHYSLVVREFSADDVNKYVEIEGKPLGTRSQEELKLHKRLLPWMDDRITPY
ncbi:MAG: hypothetical protein DWP92_01695 [Armatimonadetes bacterium]|nr:MAG: hypothetical protein DWP92_01695 [Armatimonadota bacterium]